MDVSNKVEHFKRFGAEIAANMAGSLNAHLPTGGSDIVAQLVVAQKLAAKQADQIRSLKGNGQPDTGLLDAGFFGGLWPMDPKYKGFDDEAKWKKCGFTKPPMQLAACCNIPGCTGTPASGCILRGTSDVGDNTKWGKARLGYCITFLRAFLLKDPTFNPKTCTDPRGDPRFDFTNRKDNAPREKTEGRSRGRGRGGGGRGGLGIHLPLDEILDDMIDDKSLLDSVLEESCDVGVGGVVRCRLRSAGSRVVLLPSCAVGHASADGANGHS